MSQIFQKNIPKNILFDFLKKFCNKTNEYYIFTKETYKLIQLKKDDNHFQNFYDSLKPYYFKSKLFYLERKFSYKNFITVLRQICKFLHIPYTSKIVYSKSTYEIKYFIYHD